MKENHEKVHNPQFVKCEICFKEVRTVSIRLHKEIFHDFVKGGKKVCTICGASVRDMSGHLRTHQNILKMKKKEICPICKKQYSFQRRNNNMSKHMAKHALIKQHQCKQCDSF